MLKNGIGADMARGSLTGSAPAQRRRELDYRHDAPGNEIRLQSDKTLMAFFAPLASIPSLQIGRLT